MVGVFRDAGGAERGKILEKAIMSEPFLGEIKVTAFGFAPKGWATCNGQLLPINQNQALFSLLGTTYGGDGRTTFALPNLKGRVPVHAGGGISLGQSGGEETHTLTLAEMPSHTHAAIAGANPADQASPAAGFWADGNVPAYSSGTPGADMASQAVALAGGDQPHANLPPFLVVNYVIALAGIFPTRP
jgi:microcystin-dependent protein